MKVKPLFALGAVLMTGVAAGPMSAGAADPPVVVHFQGRAAQAILTDCRLDEPIGTVCSAVDVFASEERFQSRGEKASGPFVYVLVYEVVIDGSEPDGFTATLVAEGGTESAEVSVAHNLSSASASAPMIELVHCEGDEMPECTPAGTMSVEADWTATGNRETSTFHDRFSDGSLSFSFNSVDAFRAATAGGVVDGLPVHETPLFPPSIFSTNNGFVERISD